MSDLPHEEFWILLLNRGNKVIDQIKVSQGGLAGTVVDTKIILKQSLEKLASSIVLCHNHPSGKKEPSNEDKIITQKLKTAFEAVDIMPLDHIIIAKEQYFSFADEGIF